MVWLYLSEIGGSYFNYWQISTQQSHEHLESIAFCSACTLPFLECVESVFFFLVHLQNGLNLQ